MADKETASETPWIEWKGGECPVEPDSAVVDCKFRAPPRPGEIAPTPCPAFELAWYHDGERDDIIAYRVIPS